jgi:hypothetical protein
MKLITAGDVYSLPSDGSEWAIETWPTIVEKRIKAVKSATHTGEFAASNSLIARRAIHAVKKALEFEEPEDILLLVMWSNSSNRALLVDDGNALIAHDLKQELNGNNKDYNPYAHVLGTDLEGKQVDIPHWIPINSSWKPEPIAEFYEKYDNKSAQVEDTVWNMLQVQNYCELKGVKYNWMNISSALMLDSVVLSDEHFAWAFDELDVDSELYTEGLWNYIHERNDTALFARDGLQVSSLGHEQFADKIIIPFLNSKGVY